MSIGGARKSGSVRQCLSSLEAGSIAPDAYWMGSRMVYKLLRAWRTPLICVVGSMGLLLVLHQLLAQLPPSNSARSSSSSSSVNRKSPGLPAQAQLLPGLPRIDVDPPAVVVDDEKNRPLDLKTVLHQNAQQHWAQGSRRSHQCAPYPRYEDLVFKNPDFQWVTVGNLSYFFYNAYYDCRPAAPEVMVLAMVTTVTGPYPAAFCQLWYEDGGQPDLVPVTDTKVGWYDVWGDVEGIAYPTMFSCVVPEPDIRVPQLVSLVFGSRCAPARNALIVINAQVPQRPPPNSKQQQLRTGVCVKFLSFPDRDVSDRMVEWLELLRLLGVERVVAFDIGELTANTSRTLAHYADVDGLLQLRPHQVLEEQSDDWDLRSRLTEVLMYNDCLYRNMYEFDYLGVFDVDEVIMPLGELLSYRSLLQQLQQLDVNCSARSSFCFRNVYFPKELAADPALPQQFYMLSHVTRVADHLDANLAIKCLHNPQLVTLTHNHFPMRWRAESCGPMDVPVHIGQMQHYRHVDDEETLSRPTPVRDDNILRFRQQLVQNCLDVHRRLGWT
ncbi:uncharacterized protein LOC111070656 [Drosophila obscura]|uniref:uncharacterized protein LOC111070656 n=1 Tax=Drosophila obscura TaxID=7282 RepID=UPI001BB231A0|nr:uncharacterized protein LOC111070656 [Drosophila obscura]